jgi:hypothetical protein
MEMTWREAMRFAIWLMENKGGTLAEFRMEQSRRPQMSFFEWSKRVDEFQKK